MNTELNEFEIRKALENERQNLLESMNLHSGDGSEILPANPDHGDLARIYDIRQRAIVLESIVEEKLAQIKAAFQRLEAGTYGLCLKCEKEIHPDRLRAIPYAELCVACQSRAES